MNLEEESKTKAELNPEGQDAYCRRCWLPSREVVCRTCFWNTEKYVPLGALNKIVEEFPIKLVKIGNNGERFYEGSIILTAHWFEKYLKLLEVKPKNDIKTKI